MELLGQRIDQIYVDVESRNSSLVQRLQNSVVQNKITFVERAPYAEARGSLSAKEFDRSKREFFVTPFKGSFFKRCPGAKPGLACCNYFVLNLGLQCDMNCSYCYLQSFINTPLLTIYSNLEQALEELVELGHTHKNQKIRIGTGETIDSLSLDPLTLYSRELIAFFKDFPQWRLEFKTKSNFVEQFLETEHAGNVIVSWSINPQNIISSEEHLTASLDERLLAARKCVDRGYQIAFHLDPMIWHVGWQQSYMDLVEAVVAKFKPTEIPYISLGALRFQPEQKSMMRERFGLKSLVTRAEMHPSKDGKLRYDLALRNQMFKLVIDAFKAKDSKWNIFLCMEAPESWLSSFEAPPRKVEGLGDLFSPISKNLKQGAAF